MNFSSWAATVVASPAIAAGILLVAPAVAQAAPDDTGSSSTENSSAGTSTEAEATSPGAAPDGDRAETRDDSDDSDADATEDDDSDAADDDSDADAEAADASDDADAPADVEPLPGPHYVPSSVREFNSEALVSVTADDDDEDTDHDSDDDPDDGADDDSDNGTVQLAIDQLAEARAALRSATWGDGNLFAGLAAMLPQMLMSGAQTNLERWTQNHARLQEQFIETLNNPFANAIIRMRLENSMYRPIRAQDQMELAEKLMPVVGWFGPREAVLNVIDLVHDARDHGLVYEILDLTMQYNDHKVRTEPVIYISVNGGERVPVLLDSGSTGFVIDPRDVGYEGLGAPTGEQGSASYGDGDVTSYFHPYTTTIQVGKDIYSAETEVLIIDLESVYDFTNYNGNYVGVLGIGNNAQSPGSVNVLAALPGLLGRGLLIDERRRRVILGPNPYAARLTVEGTPKTPLKLKVGDNDAVDVTGWLDTGGLVGEVPSRAVDGASNVPAGTLISVYTEDGETLLYSYRTTAANTPRVVADDAEVEFNTGYLPFSLTSIYFDFGGDGKTVFNYR